MTDVALNAEPRSETGSGPAGRLRRAGRVPAVLYGLDAPARPVSVARRDVEHILHSASGANTLVALHLDGEDTLTLIRQVQRHPTRGELLHVDFVRIRRDVAVTAEVPVHLDGEAPGTRAGGILEQALFTLSISAKPADIPVALVVDVSGLDLGGQLFVRDVPAPAGVTLLADPDELVVQVAVPRGVAAAAGEAEGGAGEAAPAAGEAAAGAPGPGGPGGDEPGGTAEPGAD
jgi:large subunit ribosomal protein L25